MVFTIHISTLSNYKLEDSLGALLLNLKELLSCLSCVAVPLFLIISGALFFRNYCYEKTFEKIKNRIFSLVIPYLIWNCIWLLFDLFCSYFLSDYFIGRGIIKFDIPTVLKGIFLYGRNLPFWFIFDLILFTPICPFIYAILRNKKIGIISIVLIWIIVGVTEHKVNFLFRNDAILYYLVGSYVGIHNFTWFKAEKKLDEKLISVLIVIGCFLYFYYFKSIRQFSPSTKISYVDL